VLVVGVLVLALGVDLAAVIAWGAGAMAMNRREEEIDAAKVEALVDALKTALPELVAIAFHAFKAELPRILPGLTDRKWRKIKRRENRRRKKSKP
jgi:hypothetical protein